MWMGGARGIRDSIASYNGELVQPSNIIVIGNRKLLTNCFSLNKTERNFALDPHTEGAWGGVVVKALHY